MPNIRDVAYLAGVSAGTVSNVLNRPSYVNPDTRRRVQSAIQALGFVPRQRSRQFRPGRVRNLGIALANLDNPFFVDVALGAESLAKELDVGIVISNSAYDPVREDQNLELLVQQRVQGIIISPVDEKSSQLQALRDRGVPMVFVDRVTADRDCWSVVVDDRRGGELGMEHLLDKGHTRIAFVGHPEQSSKVATRLLGARDAISKHSESPVSLEVLSVESWTVQGGKDAAEILVARSPELRPTAVFCSNDMMALGMLQTLDHSGIRVPKDIALVGYDDLEWAGIAMIPLTTVRQPRRLLGRTAVEMIMELLDDPNQRIKPRHVVLQPELVIRETT
jgi:LacI family transcriptional regulator